jgi:hypothetical protein
MNAGLNVYIDHPGKLLPTATIGRHSLKPPATLAGLILQATLKARARPALRHRNSIALERSKKAATPITVFLPD